MKQEYNQKIKVTTKKGTEVSIILADSVSAAWTLLLKKLNKKGSKRCKY